MQSEILITMLREASNVTRCHTLPHHGEYTVGKHSYDAAMLLMVLNPEASFSLVKAVLFHDVGERWTGDTPAPAKWADGELGKRLSQLERRCLNRLGLEIQLTPDEREWLAAVDIIEMLLWCKDQLAMGNMNAAAVIGNIISYMDQMKLPKAAREFVEKHQWTRTSDQLPK